MLRQKCYQEFLGWKKLFKAVYIAVGYISQVIHVKTKMLPGIPRLEKIV